MTRDEAIEKLRKAQPRIDTTGNCSLWLDAFVALGMLELDEPPTMKDRVETLLVGKKLATCSPRTMGAEIGLSDVDVIRQTLDAAGLKIVEK